MRTALLLTLLWLPSVASAQDAVVLAEVVPALEGTELGALEIGPAPPPGRARRVTRGEVLAALRRAGRSTRGLSIPRVIRVRREARTLSAEALTSLARSFADATLSPCRIESFDVHNGASVATGPLEVAVEGQTPRRSGAAPVVVVLTAGGRETRVPAQARVACPAPVIRPGARVQLVARFGRVEATAPGVARQPGRVGDVIRVQNLRSRATLSARVLDDRRVEVLP